MKAIVVAGALVALSGCAIMSGPVGPASMPKDAYGAIWSAKPTDQVAACFRERGVPTVYQARTAPKNPGGYPTVVAVTDQSAMTAQDERVTSCV
ncbi:hypothetical protein [uncultured Sphingomonas sp.]|uniref:hypothetical protein n=1 Tax=uncultured Sphingomonas sp. TaxID=158754 RepID=UPI0025D826FF|nr:hypothetical protein [uncultured Sphingomonas sp.]